jgi:hypothetical protein
MSSCEFDCLAQYQCGQVEQLPPGAIYGPWVQIGLSGEGTNITVGNHSSPPDNHACIKSFEYGFSEGAGMKVEIYDEEGSRLSTFVNRISKTVCQAPNDYKLTVNFGWITVDCNGNTNIISTQNFGNTLYFLPLKIEVAFENGKIKYTIEGTDLQDRISETRVENARGTEDARVDLKTAIRELFADSCPKIDDIRFTDAEHPDAPDGWHFKNSDGGPNGPRAVWTTDQQNAMATTRKWISPLLTENDKGVILQWKQDEDHPVLVLLEDPNPAPDENESCCENSIGTYIVNGGNCTPVLGFTPQINWALSSNAGSGGQQAGGASANNQQQVGRPDSNIERVGTQTQWPVNQNDNMWRPQDLIVHRAQEANAAHEAANRFREVPQSINAELKLMGDPSLAFPLGGSGLVGKSVSLVVINPFYIQECEWIAQPPCNEMLSNKRWMIMGANHQIREGSYTTTLKLFLAVPNVDLEPGTPLGGPGCGRLTFDNDRSGGNDEDS